MKLRNYLSELFCVGLAANSVPKLDQPTGYVALRGTYLPGHAGGFPLPTWINPAAVAIAAIALLMSLAPSLRCETFLLGEGQTNSITVATNEAIIVTFMDSNNPYALYQSGDTISLAGVYRGYAFAGPCTLLFKSSALISFTRLQSTSFKTLVLGAVTNTLIVPEHKSIRIYPTDGLFGAKITFSIGVNSRTVGDIGGIARTGSPPEFNGPLAVAITGAETEALGYPFRLVLTYSIVEDQIDLIPPGAIYGPAGVVKLSVERSTNLTNWSPGALQLLWEEDTRAFYRLRIDK